MCPHLQCPDSDLKFSSQIGLSQHRRHRHAREYNREVEVLAAQTKDSAKARKPWTAYEQRSLALAELLMRDEPLAGPLEAALGAEFGWTANAIKCLRRLRAYRTLHLTLDP